MSSIERMLKLKTSDGALIEAEARLVARSETLRFLIEDVTDSETILIPNVDGPTMSMIVEACRSEQRSRSRRGESEEGFEAEFLVDDTDVIYHLFMAANYLNIGDVLDKVAKKGADLIKGKTVEEIHQQFKIESDFTEEEERKLREESSSAFELSKN